jgi:acyl-CoA synthetase (AMP-forming)/AMP-acid ligase II
LPAITWAPIDDLEIPLAAARGHDAYVMAKFPSHLTRYIDGFWRGQTLADMADALVAADADAPMFRTGESVFTRGQITGDAQALSAAMAGLGLKPGDVISFLTPNWVEAAVINLAAAISGLIVNPIVHIYRDAEVAMMLSDCGAKMFFIADSFRGYSYADMAERLRPNLPDLAHIVLVRGERAGALCYDTLIAEARGTAFARPTVDPSSVKLLLYTSGTTGRPKAVLHSHNSLTRAVECCVNHWGIDPGDAIIMPSPVTHVSGYSNGLELPFIAGTQTVLMESWNADAALGLIEQHQVTGTVAATPFLTELANAARAAGTSLPSLKFFACGGAAVPPDVIPNANAAFENCRAFRVFGSSEVPLVTLGYPAVGAEKLAATTDGAIIDYEVKILNDGEILARGPAMFLGYADAKQTAEAITEEGYFRTGDIGCITPEGALLITGRKKDLIIRGGENISAKEIEDALHTHADVREAAVVAMPHARLGEGICAFIIGTASADTLIIHIAASGLAKQKTPERFEFVTDFPRTASGKIRKDQLREMAKDAP